MKIHESAYKVILPFGKHKGKSFGLLAESSPEYLEWLMQIKEFPENIRTAARKAIMGESLEHLKLPSRKEAPAGKVRMWVARKKTIGVAFPFDKELLERFKLTVDGRIWNVQEKQWEFPVEHLNAAIEVFGGTKNIHAEEAVKQLYRAELEHIKALDAIRQQQDSDIEIPTLLPLRNYQKVGVLWLEQAGGRGVVGDQMGLGKTATAIGYAVKHKLKTLVLCPKSCKIGWQREIKRFAGKDACIYEGDSIEGRKNAQFHICNYDLIKKYIVDFRKLEFDLLVCDEATYLKNYRSERAKMVFGVWNQRKKYPGLKTQHAIMLTGTPILNKIMELYTLLSFLDKKRFNNPLHFMNRYGTDKSPRNLEELHQRTKQLVIRRLKSDVAIELPEKQQTDLYVEMTSMEKKQYNAHMKSLFQQWNSIGRPSAAQMPQVRNFLFDLKFPRIIEFIDELLESGRPILVFTIQQEHATRIFQHYGDTARIITGQVNGIARQRAIDDLRDGKAQVGVFTIMAGGMGIDGLQQSMSDVLMVDKWWVPAIHDQAEDRLHRSGQTQPVTVWNLMVKDTFDEIMHEIIQEKRNVIDTVVDGQLLDVQRNKSVFKDVVNRLSMAMYKNITFDDIEDSVEEV